MKARMRSAVQAIQRAQRALHEALVAMEEPKVKTEPPNVVRLEDSVETKAARDLVDEFRNGYWERVDRQYSGFRWPLPAGEMRAARWLLKTHGHNKVVAVIRATQADHYPAANPRNWTGWGRQVRSLVKLMEKWPLLEQLARGNGSQQDERAKAERQMAEHVATVQIERPIPVFRPTEQALVSPMLYREEQERHDDEVRRWERDCIAQAKIRMGGN